MTPTIRPELEALPARLRTLPLDERGYPVPWFVAWENGKPEFRAMDGAKWVRAVRERLCWVCGDPLGAYMTFVIGPMCGLNRTTAEPACHRECAEWSARNCPFLSRPHMVRREDERFNAATHDNSPGCPILRNPGVTLLWTTKSFQLFPDGKGKHLIRIGEATSLQWFAEGRAATRAEVEASVTSGLPALQSMAEEQDREEPFAGAVAALARMTERFKRLWPTATGEHEGDLRVLQAQGAPRSE